LFLITSLPLPVQRQSLPDRRFTIGGRIVAPWTFEINNVVPLIEIDVIVDGKLQKVALTGEITYRIVGLSRRRDRDKSPDEQETNYTLLLDLTIFEPTHNVVATKTITIPAQGIFKANDYDITLPQLVLNPPPLVQVEPARWFRISGKLMGSSPLFALIVKETGQRAEMEIDLAYETEQLIHPLDPNQDPYQQASRYTLTVRVLGKDFASYTIRVPACDDRTEQTFDISFKP
jgi:hypothetical protein